MPRKKAPASEPRAMPVPIHRDAVYGLEAATYVLGLASSSLQREIALHRIKHARRGGRVVFLGSWLLQWIEDGAERPDNGHTESVIHSRVFESGA